LVQSRQASHACGLSTSPKQTSPLQQIAPEPDSQLPPEDVQHWPVKPEPWAEQELLLHSVSR
jgi:hypothetical protein